MNISQIRTRFVPKNNSNIDIKTDLKDKAIQYFTTYDRVKPNFENIQAYNTNISFGRKDIRLGLFKKFAVNKHHPLWQKLIEREEHTIPKPNELRTPFEIDETRILHSNGYLRMAGKTQVFSFPKINSTSTRLSHVNQVSSVAESIANALGLNVNLTRAIAKGHDIGHAPFGHSGERVLNSIIKDKGIISQYWEEGFYHEKNSLRFIDDIETEIKANGESRNLNLTYAVRDGIVSHCGEVDENGLIPRKEYIDLRTIQKGNRPQPFTWEGCVMKISDKIAYLGKDIEDAIDNKFLDPDKLNLLKKRIKEDTGIELKEINNTILINHFISDLVKNSNPEEGLKFSEPTFKMMNIIKGFNLSTIYLPKDKLQGPYYDLDLGNIYNALEKCYNGKSTLNELNKLSETKPNIINDFKNWLIKYSDLTPDIRKNKKLTNKVLYKIDNPNDYKLAIIEYISSLTDKNAKQSVEELIYF